MNFWLLHIGEGLPMDEGSRRYRYGHLAGALVEQGHTVCRWAPTFMHTTKRHRAVRDQVIEVEPGYHIQLVLSRGYAHNISVARVRAYRELARRFGALAPNALQPDLIVAAIPSLDWAQAALDYGAQIGVPVVIDVRDLWPDVYLNAAPAWATPLVRPMLAPLYRQCRDICRRADALTGVSETYLQWALSRASRAARPVDRAFAIGYEPPTAEIGDARMRAVALGVDPDRTICLYAGLFEKTYDVGSIIEAARIMQYRGKTQFVLCGDGSKMRTLRRQAAGLPNVIFTGWLGNQDLAALMQVAAIGLGSYTARAPQSLPNKPFEYMSWRLANVSSLKGELASLLAKNDCGLTYQAQEPADLARQIARLIESPAWLNSMQQRGFELWQREFRCGPIYKRFARHLIELAEARANGRATRAA